VITLGVLFLATTTWTPLFAQEHTPDQHTLLLLHCNGNLSGAQGETPTQAQSVTFETGIFGNGAYFAPGNQVYFPSAGNLSSTAGTLEFWIKPRWNGNDGRDYLVLRFGVGGGMYFAKDGANNWRSILNRFGINHPEVGVAFNISTWQANQWHHAAFTWRSDSLKLYLDGQLLRESRVTVPLTVVNEPTFQLGADFSSYYLDAVIDELRISDNMRSNKEVQAGFLAGLTVSSLSIQPDSLKLVESQQQTFKLAAQTNLGKKAIPAWAAKWSSADPAIATVDENGRVAGITAGKTTITASYKGVSVNATVVVIASTPNDLEVMYIERNPKYPRYIAVYQDPTIFTDDWVPYRVSVPKGLGGGQTSTTPRWPKIGEAVTFIAHVVNHGATAQSGFSYEWYFDGQSVGSGVSTKVLAPYDTAQVAWNWTWDGNRHKVKFVIQTTDDRPANNALEDFTDALALYTFIERGHDAKFASESSNYPNAITGSEIEWFQLHARRMNEMFAAAGSLARIRYDKLEMIPDGAPLFDGDTNAWLLYDGSFPQVLRADEETYRTVSGYYDRTEDIDYGFLHELGHQLGLIDLYRINVDASQNQVTGASRATIRCLMNGVDHFF
jgi:Concanavalin A-like lectin/glucanases superfamily/Bacterial Ig-like domain (group 2)/CARDB